MIGVLKQAGFRWCWCWSPSSMLPCTESAASSARRPLVTPKVFADDPESFDPKVVRYEVFGSGSAANINYLDLDAKPQRVDAAAIPWSLTLETARLRRNILAQATEHRSPAASSLTARSRTKNGNRNERVVTYCFVEIT